jgi:hypothetical protein
MRKGSCTCVWAKERGRIGRRSELRWAGHELSIRRRAVRKKYLVGKLGERRGTLLRHKHRKDFISKTDLEESIWEGVDWINLAVGMKHWRGL